MKPNQGPVHKPLEHSSVIVYPLYLNADVGRADGRKISKSEAVKNPNPSQMQRAAEALGFKVELQMNSRHPRDFWNHGRISVKFFDGEDKDKKPLNPEINTRRKLYREIAKKIAEIGAAASAGMTKSEGGIKMTSQEKAKMKRELKKKRGKR